MYQSPSSGSLKATRAVVVVCEFGGNGGSVGRRGHTCAI